MYSTFIAMPELAFKVLQYADDGPPKGIDFVRCLGVKWPWNCHWNMARTNADMDTISCKANENARATE